MNADGLEHRRALVLGSVYPGIFGDFPVYVMILDRLGRIMFCNDEFLSIMPGRTAESVVGLRFGEAISCINQVTDPSRAGTGNAAAAPGRSRHGCGREASCRYCGMERSVESALRERTGMEECSITRSYDGKTESLELNIWSKPVLISGEPFELVVAYDISAAKRREFLERTFYHDIVNTATGLRSIFDLVGSENVHAMLPGEQDYFSLARSASAQLVEEIVSQRELRLIETHGYSRGFSPVEIGELLAESVSIYSYLARSVDVQVTLEPGPEGLSLITDRTLVKRVVGNLLKNGIEATERGKTVSLAARSEGNEVVIEVANPGRMPDEVRVQLFHRSFTTKGRGRGIGTYLVKLIVEDYLHGSVRLTRSDQSGTIFTVRLPARPPAA